MQCSAQHNPLVEPAVARYRPWRGRAALEVRILLDPLEQVLDRELLAESETMTSAILDLIDLSLWDPRFGADIAHRRLVIVSDLMENMPSPGINHYKKVPSLSTVLSMPIGKRLKSKNWSGMLIDLVYLPDARAPQCQGVAHLEFWKDLFAALGARIQVLPPFEGMALGVKPGVRS